MAWSLGGAKTPLTLVPSQETPISTIHPSPKTLTVSPKHLRFAHPVHKHIPMNNPITFLAIAVLGGLFGFGIIGYGIFCMIRDSNRCWWK